MAGRFITFEGGEGAGKSTQARLLVDALGARGICAELTREPGGTAGAEAIRALLLDPPGDGWNAQAEALLFAAARADHLAKRILPALAAQKWVICDRFLDSSRAYQGGAGGVPDTDLMALHQIGSNGILPDLTFLIEVSEDIVAARLASRDQGRKDAIEARDRAYHAKVSRTFLELAAEAPDRFVRIDGSGTLEQTHGQIMAALVRFEELQQ